MLKARLIPFEVAPGTLKPMIEMEKNLKNSGLEHSLIEMVKTRASQINGCAYCIHMHTADARAAGETEERLYMLSAWWESSLYTARERAALLWTDALTLVAETRAPDTAYEGLKGHFTDAEIVKLTLLITTINAWNRIAIGFRMEHPKSTSKAA